MLGVITELEDHSKVGVIKGEDGVVYKFLKSDCEYPDGLQLGGYVLFEVAKPVQDGKDALAYKVAPHYSFNDNAPAQHKEMLEDQRNWGAFNWLVHSFKNAVNFQGRARRKEYWMTNLVYLTLVLISSVLMQMNSVFIALYLAVILIFWLPILSLFMRRLHDIGLSGWYIVVAIIPLVNIIFAFYVGFAKGETNTNKWGYPSK